MKRDPRLIDAALAELDQRHLRRRRRTVEAFPDPDSRACVVVDGRKLVDFCSNDYLGLARHPEMAKAMSDAAAACGAGSGAAHLVTGHGLEHEQLEEELAAFTGRERALLFSTGYMANLAAVGAFAGRGETVLLDRLNHASLIDAALLSGARFRRYAHGDAAEATRMLTERAAASGASSTSSAAGADSAIRSPSGDVSVVATDGVFSMDGDLAPLPALAAACRTHAAWLVVDDAHGLGVIGPGGRGTLEHFGLSADDVPLLVGTLGKAFGSFGAFVAGSADVIELLMQRARTYVYTTALPQPVAAATRAALRIVQRDAWRREHVLALTARFRAAARQNGVPLMDSLTPIQPVLIGDTAAALAASERLRDLGFWVAAIRPPTVPHGSARLRVTLTAGHTEAQVDALVEALTHVCGDLGSGAHLAADAGHA